jgi:hypothetical protein
MAIACRRGGVAGKDIGAIRLGPRWSTVEVAAGLARDFAEAAAKPDERNPRVQFSPMEEAERPLPPPPPRVGGKPPWRRAPKGGRY